MRLLTLALLGLMLAATPALAARKSGPTEGHRVAAAKPVAAPATKARPAAPGRVQMVAYRAPAAPVLASRGRTAKPAACTGRRCRTATVTRARFGWSHGLPPAAGIQANICPDGTLATLARGHDDVVRCMPI